jgi:hypothetical protein
VVRFDGMTDVNRVVVGRVLALSALEFCFYVIFVTASVVS